MAFKLILSAGSTEQREALAEAVEAALAEHGVGLPEPDPRPPAIREMFASGEVVRYTLETLGVVGTTAAAIGVGVVSNAIYARLKFLHPRDEIERDRVDSGFEVVNHTSGARVELAEDPDGDGA